MQTPKDMSAFQWLAPSMVRDGLIKNSAWIPPACEKAVSLFSDPALLLPASFLAALSKFAIDYIEQAPVLVLAVTGGANLAQRKERLRVARRFAAACSTGPRLSKLMKAYGLAPQLRALSGLALRQSHRPILKILSTIPPSTLAQRIAKSPEEQRIWLEHVLHTSFWYSSERRFVAWAAVNFSDEESWSCVSDLADFIRNNRSAFNWRWNFAQAKAASDRWHGELADIPYGGYMPPDWRKPIDYAPLPPHVEIDGFAFHALRTREDLWIEGAEMHHCVRTYADRVVNGSSRIYSVRQCGQRVATLELVCSRSRAPKFELGQLKGPCNARPPLAIASAAKAFVAKVCPGAHPADVQPPSLPLNTDVTARAISSAVGERVRAMLRAQLGDDIYSSWFGSMEFESFEGRVVRASVPVRFLQNWIQSHYADDLLQCCAAEFAGVECVEVTLPTPGMGNGRWPRGSGLEAATDVGPRGACGSHRRHGADARRRSVDGLGEVV
jgi:hypothetical protein